MGVSNIRVWQRNKRKEFLINNQERRRKEEERRRGREAKVCVCRVVGEVLLGGEER